MKNVFFSIVIPVFNGEMYLQDTFDSIRSQRYRNFELIVVDGKSTDRTLEIIESNKDIITKFLSESDTGMYDAVEKGFKMSSGEFMCYINSDDRLVPAALELVNKKLSKHHYDIVFGHVNYISSSGDLAYMHKAINIPRIAVKQMRRLPFAQQSCFWSRHLYEKIGGFDKSLKFVADSKFFLTAYLDKDAKRGYVNSVLGEFRMHNTSLTIGSSEKMMTESRNMRIDLLGPKKKSFIRILFEAIVKINNLKGVYEKKRYSGTKF